jgi:hypothetical protein
MDAGSSSGTIPERQTVGLRNVTADASVYR